MQGITQVPRPPSRPWSSSCQQLLQHREATTDSELLDFEDNGIFIPPGPTISPSDKFKNEHGVPHELIVPSQPRQSKPHQAASGYCIFQVTTY